MTEKLSFVFRNADIDYNIIKSVTEEHQIKELHPFEDYRNCYGVGFTRVSFSYLDRKE